MFKGNNSKRITRTGSLNITPKTKNKARKNTPTTSGLPKTPIAKASKTLSIIPRPDEKTT